MDKETENNRDSISCALQQEHALERRMQNQQNQSTEKGDKIKIST